MSTIKKILALTLALAMVMSLGVFATFNDQEDIDEDCAPSMELMNALGIITGDNGNAKPLAPITRAEAAAMIYRLMNKGRNDATIYNGGKYFTDVPAGAWYEGYVNYCYTMNIIQGRTATTFDPQAPVTGMEIAKMLLVCCGYQSDVQGYTGANWAFNVQKDAFSAGMIDNFGMALSVPAQRQWVAVMFNDALNCYTVRTYLGETVETDDTLGAKKFDYKVATGVINAIDSIELVTDAALAKYTTVGTTNYKKLADNALLGQEVNVYYKDVANSSGNYDTVYAIVPTSSNTVSEAMLCNVKLDDGKYTVGTLTGALETDPAAVVLVNDGTSLADGATTLADLGKNSTTMVKAIDNNDDGDIDVILMTKSTYGEIKLNKSGDMTEFDGAVVDIKADDINMVNDVATGDFVKMTANVYTGKNDVEALSSKVAILTRITSTSYTLAGTAYKVSEDAVADMDMSSFSLKAKVVFYTDGKFIVSANTPDTVVSADMPTLVLLTAKGHAVTTDPYAGTTDTYLVKVLGLDNKVTEYEFSSETTTFGDIGETPATDTGLIRGSVYELVDNDDGTYDLVPLEVSYAEGKYELKTLALAETMDLDISAGRLDDVRVGSDVKMFMTYTKDSKPVYTVVSLADLKSDQTWTEGALYYFTTVNGIESMVCGAFGGNFNAEESDTIYAITVTNSVENYDVDADENYFDFTVVYANDPTEEVTIKTETDPHVTAGQLVTIVENNGVYTVTQCDYDTLVAIDAIAADAVKFNGGSLTDVASDAIVALETADGLEFVSMAKIVSIYEDVNDAQEDYSALTGCQLASNSSSEYYVLYFAATIAG